ncbi:hypothetical protein D051_0618 [Vibrio parahaemolyticus VPCR-2010]|uniref:hypothetical protein n=1 Tax=Vibrio parahaemolyticus TaxID=670 RepID=UPI00038E470B|nr:hypothetical protein D051_0618 [Vibrio parahaemolyticus VPCR-2010]
MALVNEQSISAKELIDGLLSILKPANREDVVHEIYRDRGVPEHMASESVGLFIGLLDQVDEDQYIEIRERLNDVFKVGEYQEFDSYVEEETEFGDLCETFDIIFRKLFPTIPHETDMISYEFRLQWRNALLEELDEMVAR